MEDICEQLMLPGPSPCVKHCGIDESLVCSGCYRTGREIARWKDMTEKEQWDLLAELEKRRPTR
jgi:uncharacterized protein